MFFECSICRSNNFFSIVFFLPRSPAGVVLAQVGESNRKDVRNAVEAAKKAQEWIGHLSKKLTDLFFKSKIIRKTIDFGVNVTNQFHSRAGPRKLHLTGSKFSTTLLKI